MFKRLIYDNWTEWIPIIAFVITFVVFLMVTIRALLMKKETAERMAMLPIESAAADEFRASETSEGRTQTTETKHSDS